MPGMEGKPARERQMEIHSRDDTVLCLDYGAGGAQTP